MSDSPAPRLLEEDLLVAELARLGVRYLSRRDNRGETARPRPPQQLLADLVRQPSSRVRLALITLLLSHPDYAESARAALELLPSHERDLFKLLYTAAVFLQREYTEALQRYLSGAWCWLPDLFSAGLGIPRTTPREALGFLAQLHMRRTGAAVNWLGTYHHTVRQLLHRWELESQWNRSQPTR